MVIEKLQAGAQKAQAVACKLESPPPSAEGEQALVSMHMALLQHRFQTSI